MLINKDNINNYYITPILNNNVYTKAVYEVYNNGDKLKYESYFISIIDIPYRRYKLEG